MLRAIPLSLFLFGATALPAFAQEFTAVQTIERKVETPNPDGTVATAFVAADRVVPGEELFYKLTYDNASLDAAENVSLVMNVSPDVIYSENTANVAGQNIAVAFSTDNGASFAPRGELSVSVEGKPRPAGSEDITNIRWSFAEPIPPGTRGIISFTAIVR